MNVNILADLLLQKLAIFLEIVLRVMPYICICHTYLLVQIVCQCFSLFKPKKSHVQGKNHCSKVRNYSFPSVF